MSAVRLRVSAAEIEAAEIRARGDRNHYLAHVRRLAIGDELELFDGSGRVRAAKVRAASADEFVLEPIGPLGAQPSAGVAITSLFPLIKGDRTDLVVAKLTELGVRELLPFRAERSVVALDGERADRRLRRFARLAAEASRQSGRADVPHIAPIASFGGALAAAGPARTKLLFAPGGAGLRQVELPTEGQIAIATGPEGGFSAAEIEAATAAGFVVVALGPRILRAETGAIVAASAVGALVGDLGGI